MKLIIEKYYDYTDDKVGYIAKEKAAYSVQSVLLKKLLKILVNENVHCSSG